MEKNNIKPFTDVDEFIHYIETRRRFSKKISLDNVFYLASLFDNPHTKFKSIHVTGTNGKGSTVAYLRNIYKEAGYKVASFTSPYVIKFNERIWYDGNFISDEDLLKYGNMIIQKYDQIIAEGHELPAFFEFITILAFIYFASLDIDVAILEVGMGGRLDATNIVTPLVSVITSIGLDHMSILGNTTLEILNEKLGIVKNSVPLVTGLNDDVLLKRCEKVTKELNSMLINVDYNKLNVHLCDSNQSIFSYKDKKNVVIKLLGRHQVENACVAIEVVEIINKISTKSRSNLVVSDVLLYKGLLNCFWPGRFEKLSDEPLIFVDGGHNIACISRICEFVKQLPYERKRAVISISDDKEKDKMIGMLDEVFDDVIFTEYDYARRAEASNLYSLSNAPHKMIIKNIDEAIDYVYENKIDFTLFVGSLYLASDIRAKILNNPFKN